MDIPFLTASGGSVGALDIAVADLFGQDPTGRSFALLAGITTGHQPNRRAGDTDATKGSFRKQLLSDPAVTACPPKTT